MPKAKEYTYRIFWSEDDGAYVATVAEFPSLSSVESQQNDALAGAVDLVDFVLREMSDNDEEPPAPIGQRRYSGEIRLRMPREVHRRVACEAAEQGVSINQLLVSRI